MKVPIHIPTRFPIELTHGFSSNFGSVNFSMTIYLDRTKYLNGESVIESIGSAILPDFKSQIQNYTREIN